MHRGDAGGLLDGDAPTGEIAGRPLGHVPVGPFGREHVAARCAGEPVAHGATGINRFQFGEEPIEDDRRAIAIRSAGSPMSR